MSTQYKSQICWAALRDMQLGLHDVSSHTYALALYTAVPDHTTVTAYVSTDETSGVGYTAGGKNLTVLIAAEIQLDGTVITQFADAEWPAAGFTARAGLIYNTSSGDRALAVVEFAEDITSFGGKTFSVRFPAGTADNAIVRLRNAE